MKPQILIRNGINYYEFSISSTGQLDYKGKVLNSTELCLDEYQEFYSSSYFSPSFYTFLHQKLNNITQIYTLPDVDISDSDTFDYLVHIGPLLQAVEGKDTLLAGELYLKRCCSFEKFAKLTAFILEPVCVEVLFSLCFCRMNIIDPETIPLIYENAKKKLNFDSSCESIEHAFTRYIKDNEMEFSLPLVGTQFYNWEYKPDILCNMTDNIDFENIFDKAEKIRAAKNKLYSGLKISVQAEPYNIYDRNSIIVCIENIETKLTGNEGLEKAGHVRAVAAKIIREAKPQTMVFNSELMQLSRKQCVIKIKL